MSYSDNIRHLLRVLEVKSTIFQKKPTKPDEWIRKALTEEERSEVDSRSFPERGYRRFTALYMSRT